MPSTYSPNLRIELIGSGEQSGTWGNTTNTNLGTLIEEAISGIVDVNVTAGDVTLTALNGISDQSRQMMLNVTGTPGTSRTITAPAVSKVYIVANGANAAVSIETALSGASITIPAGSTRLVYSDGTDFFEGDVSILSTGSRAVITDANGVVSPSAVTSTELGYVSGVTSAIQTQLNAKQATITGAASTITSSNLTASRALISNASGKVEVSSTVSDTELGYLDGVSSNIQTQLNAKAPITSGTSILYGDGSGGFSNVTIGTNLTFAGGTLNATSGGTGSVSSVGLSMPSGFSVSGSPITTSGTLAVTTSLSGILKGTGSAFTTATAGSDYLAPPSGTALLKANSGGALANATAGIDYAPATTGTSAQLLANSGSGAFSNVTVGSNLSFSGGVLSALSSGGSVTSVAMTVPTGLAVSGSPITSSGTLAITTSLSGMVKGTGSGFSSATAGTDYVAPGGALGTPSSGTLTSCTGLPISTGVSGLGTGVATFLATPSSANLASAVTDETGSGALVFATSPTLVTPALGTPSSGTLTSCTGLPISTGVSGLGTGVATFLATPSSANLAAAVTGETGSGALVFATSPTLVTPALGTPSSGTLTSCTGLPISTGVSGLGTGVATFLATPSSANLAAAVTDETGSGALVFATSPTITTGTYTGLRETKTAPAISAGNLTLNCSNGNVFAVSLNANITTITFSNVPTTGTAYALTLAFTADGTARTVTWGSSVKWSAGVAPTLTSTLNKVDVFILTTWDGGTTWYASTAIQNS